MSILNAFTVDVEDYYQVSAFENLVQRTDWNSYESRVVANTRRILRLLARFEVEGTFFVLGWTAKRFPHLVREIRRDGHEIGSHGYWHRLIYRQTPDEFRADVVQSKTILQDILGEPVRSYRAPSFSVTRESLWALDILSEEGFHFDSSVFPVRHDRYGIPDANPEIHAIKTRTGMIREFPPSVARVGMFRLPVSGGGYFRLYPLALTTHLLTHLNDRSARPFMFYIHPWELDPLQPRIASGSLKSRLRHYVNLSTTQVKLEGLLGRFRFGKMSDVIRLCTEPATPEATAPAQLAFSAGEN